LALGQPGHSGNGFVREAGNDHVKGRDHGWFELRGRLRRAPGSPAHVTVAHPLYSGMA
jgi:hypothetical protein